MKMVRQCKQMGFVYTFDGKDIGTTTEGQLTWSDPWLWNCNADCVCHACSFYILCSTLFNNTTLITQYVERINDCIGETMSGSNI